MAAGGWPAIKSFTQSDWFPVVVSLSPALPLVGVLLIPSPIRAAALTAVSNDWGGIASIWGLGVSVYLISIAGGARKAAQEAVAAEKVRSAIQELQQAAEKNTQIGVYARSQKWDAVQLRAEEVMNRCHSTVARWKDAPAFRESSNDLLLVAAQMRSIILEAAKANVRGGGILGSQVESSEKLSAVIGRIEREQDSGSN